jgi:NADPH:quinone reductase-like Zn-dependent oxidoreductase
MAATSWLFDAGRLSDEQAATIPLTLCTAGDALYNKMDPRLPLPWETPIKRPILIWGASSQVGIHAVQFAREAGCAPIIATASPQVRPAIFLLTVKHHAYIKSLGADFVFDYRDPKVEDKVKGVSKEITHTFTCVGVDEMVLGILERLTQRGGNIILALPPIRDTPNHHSEMCVAGTIMELESFEMPSFKFHGGHEPPTSSEGAKRLQGLMRWALEEAGKKYSLPRVRRLSRRGLFDAFEAIELMKAGKISGEKVVYRMDETPEI